MICLTVCNTGSANWIRNHEPINQQIEAEKSFLLFLVEIWVNLPFLIWVNYSVVVAHHWWNVNYRKRIDIPC